MYNISSSITDLKYLENFAKLHILPQNSIDLILNCENMIPTLLNNTHLSCRELSSGNLMLQIQEGNDHEVRILRKGFITTLNKTSAKPGLLLIDRPINPKWLDSSNGLIHLDLPFIAILLGVIIGMFGLLVIVSCCLICIVGDKKSNETILEAPSPSTPSTPIVGERRPLLSESRSLGYEPIYEEDESEGTATATATATSSTVEDEDDVDEGYGSVGIGTTKKTRSKKGRLLGRGGSFSEHYSTHSSSRPRPIDLNYSRN
ncbi:hypothetical protein CANARDRAFT_30450 [[Candida] arabinofermentans NRRL YB-2248]|uniref:FAS1 domain-containing protein n=1 Tax=[Candida] arabinofermentans NRRL YB-2248 TaxID=983967 RepID=A0A1E4STZ3_9ASCO|nr:hypothetical protein CANARDRAFT_30450 [[Candida] arabinofermentans NRRL YB-2248]